MKTKLLFIFLISSIFFNSCKTAGFVKVVTSLAEIEESALVNLQIPILFKTEITLFKNSFSGITVIKTLDNKNHRVVFINEVGMKFFDLEIGQDTFIVHQIFTSLNRKAFLNLLENDFRLMLFKELKFNKIIIYEDKKSEETVVRDGNKGDFYYLDSSNSYFNSNVTWRNVYFINT